ncbi:MAG TPA: biotin--[acetyl-CoA-carboxylase] ligase [Solirubrobacterales bacterium]|nr:biotin--[acetyl-CoA-carboxylase] ligase [Solirubrobacterales bacterium]
MPNKVDTPPFGQPHRHFARTDSTNSRARELAAAGAPHGTVVTASEQTAGRGRQGRTWTAPPHKALLYSAIVRPLEERHMLLPLAVPLAVCEAAEQLRPDLKCKVKWPNDVLLEHRKLAGVLIEARPQDGWAVIGVGLNLTIQEDEFPADLRTTAISIFTTCGGDREGGSSGPSPLLSGGPPLPVPLTAAAALNDRLAHWTEADPDEVLTAWRTRDALRGRKVEWEGGSGVADGVDDRGYLVVVTPAGDRIAVGAGEVHLTRF